MLHFSNYNIKQGFTAVKIDQECVRPSIEPRHFQQQARSTLNLQDLAESLGLSFELVRIWKRRFDSAAHGNSAQFTSVDANNNPKDPVNSYSPIGMGIHGSGSSPFKNFLKPVGHSLPNFGFSTTSALGGPGPQGGLGDKLRRASGAGGGAERRGSSAFSIMKVASAHLDAKEQKDQENKAAALNNYIGFGTLHLLSKKQFEDAAMAESTAGGRLNVAMSVAQQTRLKHQIQEAWNMMDSKRKGMVDFGKFMLWVVEIEKDARNVQLAVEKANKESGKSSSSTLSVGKVDTGSPAGMGLMNKLRGLKG